jgi:GNAT superfamily N-acetyltransferase
MNIHELATYNLDDAVKFHQRLNPVLWARDEHLLPEVRNKLLKIAADFQEFLGVEDLKVKDITVSGSNAAYSYTKQSDIDLHLVVEMPDDPVYQELFAAKKYQYNTEHDITIGGADVELYVQPDDQPHHSQGIYSIKNSDWVKVPQRKRSQIDDTCVLAKVDDLATRIKSAIASQDRSVMDSLWKKIKIMRQSGLENHGEFGCENVSFKLLRNNGSIGALKSAITAAQDRELSLPPKKRVRYGFSEDVTSTPDGVSASTNMFLNETPVSSVVQSFVQDVVQRLGIENMPEVVLHDDPDWSKQNNSFGQYNPDTRTLHVSLVDRHLLDILRTVAHELTHCRQNELDTLPDHAGETGSRWENQANAQAGILMRDFADANPEYFTESYTQAKSLQSSMKTFRAKVRIKDRYGSPAIEAQVVARNHDMARQLLRAQYGPDSVISTVTELKENASGYIPKNKKEAAMPQYAMALSVDIKPGQVGKEANKLALKTGRNGEPGLLQADAQNLLREFAEFVAEQDNLFEITMSPSSLRKLSAQTGALAGMEFEMIVPNIEGNDDGDQEPDYDYDQRCRSIEDAFDFFYDGDWNGRRDVERMRERMQNDYQEWLDDKIYQDWERRGEEYLEEWVPNNVDESEWNPDGLEGDERQEALEEFIANLHADPGGSDAFDEYREENQESYDESDWLDDEDLDRMSAVENAYSMNWPHWRSTGGSGEGSIEEVADSFRDAVGRPILASTSYHSGRVERPSTKNLQYIVEPDGSLNPDDSDDQGLEFVSPPLPIEELLSDLNKVKAWADRTGCYTNDSTGLHINVSVPGWTGGTDQLDYVKLALLLGDEFVLDSFGRAGNTYAKSAMGKIRDAVRKSPDRAQELMDRMKSGMDQLASKVVHSRSTEKYTSINVKDGYIEFRSPGGDWLNDNFAEIDNTLRRFTVALSAAVDPEAYRQEYLKKLYKLLDVSGEKDPLSYFAKFAAGELPKAALKSFVRQAQLERGVNRGKETGPMVWKVSNPPQSLASIEVVANSKEEAIKRATAQDGYPSWANTINSVVAEPLRPYKQEPVAPQTQGVDTRVDYELYSRASGAVIDTFPARNDDEAITRLSDYINFGAGQSNPDNFDVRRAGRAPIAGSTLDLQRQRAAASAAAAQIPTIDIDVEPAPAPQPAGMGQWNGQWKVLVGGQEVYRFGGVGNSQADANRIAAAWLRQNGQGVSGEGFEVYPVMAESLREYRMPQPSHGPGKYRDLNEPLGPEVKENFADGENPVKFTVSSLDGYQYSFQITLAVHGKHVGHFNFVRSADTDDVNNEAEVEQRWQGQGYGKLLLMKAIDVANNHGLDFQQDIRGITDAQQNVYDSLENAGLIVTPGDGFWFLTPQGEQELNGLNENFADGKNPGRKGLSKRVGVNTKASVSSLRKTAKNSSGEKQRMAHWLANMKAGRAKAKRK